MSSNPQLFPSATPRSTAEKVPAREHLPAEALSATLRERELAYQQLYAYVKDLLNVIAQRDRALAEANAAAAAKSQLLSNMSHEFKTPLTSILGFSELLARNNTDAATRDLLTRIHNAGKRIDGMVNNLLTMARLNAGAMPIELGLCDIGVVVQEESVRFAARARDKGLKFHVELPEFPLLGLMIDEARMRQALAEILDNALRFTARGEIAIRVVANHAMRVPLSVEVEDSGIGIRAEDRQRVMNAFEQGDGSSTRRVGGAGLGLTIAEALLSLIGCGLDFSSEPGRGSIFRIALPRNSVASSTT